MSELANEPASSAEALSEGANAGRGRVSAGLLVYRWSAGQVEVLLGHPGGPLWARRHAGVWVALTKSSQVAQMRTILSEHGLR